MKRYLLLGLCKALPTVLGAGFVRTLSSAFVATTETIFADSTRNLHDGESLQLTGCSLCFLPQSTEPGTLNA